MTCNSSDQAGREFGRCCDGLEAGRGLFRPFSPPRGVNEFVVVAVAEKLAAMATADQSAERRARADLDAFDRLMNGEGGEPPWPDDVP